MSTTKDATEAIDDGIPKTESAPCSSHCSTARQMVDFQCRVREMLATINETFPVGSPVVCDVFRGVKRHRIVAPVSLHQYTDGERMTSGLNVKLEDWQVDALKIHPLMIHKIRGKNVFEVPWDCVAVYASDAITIVP